MPLTAKGTTIMEALQKQYGAEKGKSVFYAMRQEGSITGVDSAEDGDSRLDAVLEKASDLAARTTAVCDRLDAEIVKRCDTQPRHFGTARWQKR